MNEQQKKRKAEYDKGWREGHQHGTIEFFKAHIRAFKDNLNGLFFLKLVLESTKGYLTKQQKKDISAKIQQAIKESA